MGGCLWGFGPLGKRYGVQGANDENKALLSSFTVLSLMLCAVFASAGNLLQHRAAGFVASLGHDAWFRVLAIALSGAISGFGGILCTYAFTQARNSESALIALL